MGGGGGYQRHHKSDSPCGQRREVARNVGGAAPQQHRVFESRGSGLIPAFPADAVLSAQATPSLVSSQRQNPSADGVSSTYGQHCAQGGSSWWEELLKSLDKYLCPEDGGSPGGELGARITGNPIRFSSRKSLSLALLPKLLILEVTLGLIKNVDLLAPTPIR